MGIVWTVDDHPDGDPYELKWVAAFKGLEIEEPLAGDLEIRWGGQKALSLSREEAGDLAALLQRYTDTGSICHMRPAARAANPPDEQHEAASERRSEAA